MCGIAGYSGRFEEELLRRMAKALAHRGPDDEGILAVAGEGVGLAHRRLSIIDLSPRGHNPMWDVTRKACIVYNGELYNYRVLREELLADGFRFHSDTDTEVVLNLYLRDGPAMLPRLNGIFAFAIWDVAKRELFLARDHLGVKPLYFAETPKGFLFASELKALLHEPSLDRTIDPTAVANHLIYLWSPAPHTMLEHVRKLPPGHALRVGGGSILARWQYWDLPYDQDIAQMSEADAIQAVREQLARSVEAQLVSDVPVGAFLSGGLDSSSVVAMAKRAQPDSDLQCFTIGFRGKDAQSEGMGRDLPYAKRVAEHLGVKLNTIYVESQMIDELETMIYHLDEPQADPAPINTLFISRMAREHGIKVLLSGTGGDDIFTGYRRHWAVSQERLWSWLPRLARSGMRGATSQLHPSTDFRRRLSKAFRYADSDGDQRIASYFYWIDPATVEHACSRRQRWARYAEGAPDPLSAALAQLSPDMPVLNRMLYLDGKFFLTDHNLNYADKIPMATGVEVRVPLLDPDLVSLAARLPLSYKQRGSVGKWVLRKAMEPFLPRDVIYREKTGFGAPLREWMRSDLRPVVDDVLSAATLRRRGLFDEHGVRALIDQDRLGLVDGSYTLFAMICVELWCQIFLDRAVPTPAKRAA